MSWHEKDKQIFANFILNVTILIQSSFLLSLH